MDSVTTHLSKNRLQPQTFNGETRRCRCTARFLARTFDALLAARSFEPDWMRDRRRDAFHVLLDTPLPMRTDEAWRRTDFGALKLGEVEVVMPWRDGEAALRGAPRSIKEAISGKGASGAIVSADGQIVASMLDDGR